MRIGRGIIIGIFIGNFGAMTACGGDDTAATDSATAGGSTSAGPTTDSTTGTTPDDLPTTTDGSGSAGTSTTTTAPTTTDTTATTDPSTGSTGTPQPVCGDGNVDDGEECDDGNADDTDTCVAGCKNAVCGDGFVGPGEACDDANDVDDDDCSNACAAASCGDGKLQPGETCDDGNDVDTDACLSTCVAAACGDGFVQDGLEECDDGNADDADECTTLCAAPSCMDGLKSGGESDIDCGGPCPKCLVDQMCIEDADCDSGSCEDGKCTQASSCQAIKLADPNAPDGVYVLDIDGIGPMEPIEAFCDMTTDGGGWTLAMRFAPTMGTFHFYSPHWTTNTLVNEAVTAPDDPSDGKFPAYNLLPGSEIRGCMRNPGDNTVGCKAYPLPMPTTLLNLFSTTPVGSDLGMKGLYFNEPNPEKIKWLTIQGRTVAESSIVPSYIATGINLDDDQSCYDARVRFGLVLNNEANVVSLNDAAGFGAQAYYTVECDIQPGVDSPWRTACGFQAGSKSYHTSGHIWIR
jgi:cysteine-rich repeat protein